MQQQRCDDMSHTHVQTHSHSSRDASRISINEKRLKRCKKKKNDRKYRKVIYNHYCNTYYGIRRDHRRIIYKCNHSCTSKYMREVTKGWY